MTISDLKALEALIKLCRKTGVSTITVDGISLELGPLLSKPRRQVDFTTDIPEASIKIPKYNGPETTRESLIAETIAMATNGISEDELLFYSAGTEQ